MSSETPEMNAGVPFFHDGSNQMTTDGAISKGKEWSARNLCM